ncbi:MAG: site-2 protease family protein, partial [Actinomycetota bacterium]|nr:site-2 protease family protein [Actinomycetota bacterium]
MGVVLTVFIVLLVIVFLVVVHELGHFTAARLAGVKCPEFFVGFGPRIWSTKRGDTEFGIKWILVGGYVKVLGMNPEEEISPEDFPHSYKGVSYWRRVWIIFSGSLTHILLAGIILFFTIRFIG